MAESPYQRYLAALDALGAAVVAAPAARTAAEAAAQANRDAVEQRRQAENDRVADHLRDAKASYRRAAGALDDPALASLGIRLPATVTPAPDAVGPLAEAEHDQHRAVVALAGAIGDHRVRQQLQADAAREAAEALEARRAHLEAARNQPPPPRFDTRLLAVVAAVALLIIVITLVVI